MKAAKLAIMTIVAILGLGAMVSLSQWSLNALCDAIEFNDVHYSKMSEVAK